MLYEIVCTQAERGILKGTSGFCPVAVTEATPKSVIKPLVDLAHRQIKEISHLRESCDAFYSHFPLVVDGHSFNLLARGSRCAESDNFLVIWLGIDKIRSLNPRNNSNQTSLPASPGRTPVPESRPKLSPQAAPPANPNSSIDPPETGPSEGPPSLVENSNNETPGLSPLSAVEVKLALKHLGFGTELPYELDSELDGKHLLFSLALESPRAPEFLDVFLDTVAARTLLPWNPDENAWLIRLDAEENSDSAKIICESAPRTADQPGRCNFYWQWISLPNDSNMMDELRSGRLMVALKNEIEVRVSIPLSAPFPSGTFELLDATLAAATMQPHLAQYLGRPEVSQLFRWTIEDLTWDRSSFPNSDLWLSAERDPSQANRMVIRMDENVLRGQLGKLLRTNLSQTNLYSEIADGLFQYHGPFGIRVDFSFNVADQQLEISPKTTIMVESPGQDNRSVVLRVPLDAKNKAKAKSSIKQQISRDIMEQFGIVDEDARKVVLAGGTGCRKLDDLKEQSRAALAGLIYEHCLEFVGLPLQLKIIRTRDLNLRQKLSFGVTAISPPQSTTAVGEAQSEAIETAVEKN